MSVMSKLINFVTMTSVLVMLWVQYTYIEADWCSSEIDTLRLQVDEMHTVLINDQEVAR